MESEAGSQDAARSRAGALRVLLLLLVSWPPLQAGELPRWNLHQAREGAEHLVYRLSYRGLFTAFLSRELANVAFITQTRRLWVEGEAACELEMSLTTEEHPFSEFMRPTRYRWRSYSDPALGKALLVEVVELTDDDREHRVSWIDWHRGRIELFRLRHRKRVPGFLGDWEVPGDGYRLLRSRLNDEPSPVEGERRMSWDKSVPFDRAPGRLLDPLGFVHAARWHDYDQGDLVAPVSYKDELRTYRAHRIGKAVIEVAGERRAAWKVEMRRRNAREAAEEGFMQVWFSDDAERTPLRFRIEGFIGRIRLELLARSPPPSHPGPCLGGQADSQTELRE